MKSHQDPRHLRRIKNMQAMFAYSCGNLEPSTPDSLQIISHLKDLDQLITTHAPKWPLDKLNQVDLATLRCAIWELEFVRSAPAKVIIDEAVEVGKEFGTEASPSFINGVLGSIIKIHESST